MHLTDTSSEHMLAYLLITQTNFAVKDNITWYKAAGAILSLLGLCQALGTKMGRFFGKRSKKLAKEGCKSKA